jgi:ribosome-binding protein aMBF1 (putative translation factor)
MVKDFLDEVSDERTRRNERFPELVVEAERRRELARLLAAERQAHGLSQTVVAARMGTAASVVSKLEAGGDVKVSTLQSYCGALGKSLTFALASTAPTRRRHRSYRR